MRSTDDAVVKESPKGPLLDQKGLAKPREIRDGLWSMLFSDVSVKLLDRLLNQVFLNGFFSFVGGMRHEKKEGRKMMPKGVKSEPKGIQKWTQIRVFYIKRQKKGATGEASVH